MPGKRLKVATRIKLRRRQCQQILRFYWHTHKVESKYGVVLMPKETYKLGLILRSMEI